ncbi:hypothetical protein GCM10009754_68530 [Amycolatopsis minnesotensis]|uniref:Secreted protein n=1 Tax=Amycolatopsis minnesotensis TaxID=337894 RepID=A0ABN2S909_9PSEU
MLRKFLAGLGAAVAFAGLSVVAPAAAVADTPPPSPSTWVYLKWYPITAGADFAKLVCDRDWDQNWASSYPGRDHSCWVDGNIVKLSVLL